MRTNPNAQGVKQPGTPLKNDGKADANMPANNFGTFPVKTGAGMKSNLPKAATTGPSKGTGQPAGPRANTPANNTTNKNVTLGTTKHAVGTVPHYLRNQSNSGKA